MCKSLLENLVKKQYVSKRESLQVSWLYWASSLFANTGDWPQVIKKSFSTLLSTKFIMLINVKMPKIVGILTFINMIDTSERFKARNIFICRYFSFYEQLKFRTQLSQA